ncbi:hypothetical protein ABZS66_12035 [Dactylosporangium sp. NPDC005572]|uniref:hypothetical protein n=1 Tax=Dactylosporangium sp. NPDC005572 TaxID=3156889 RepID=UPI0033BF2587
MRSATTPQRPGPASWRPVGYAVALVVTLATGYVAGRAASQPVGASQVAPPAPRRRAV